MFRNYLRRCKYLRRCCNFPTSPFCPRINREIIIKTSDCLRLKTDYPESRIKTYCQTFRYISDTHVSSEVISGDQSNIVNFKKAAGWPPIAIPRIFRKRGSTKLCKSQTETIKTFIEVIHSSIRYKTCIYWGAHKDASLRRLACHATPPVRLWKRLYTPILQLSETEKAYQGRLKH